jgi:polyphosphate kinase
VRINLMIRGICCLRPGVKGVSDHIRVTSTVGRFLEHSRIFYFGNGGDDLLYLGSADLMPRNLDRRVEALFPVEDPHLRRQLMRILAIYNRDTANTRVLRPDGTYTCVDSDGAEPFDAQAYFIGHDE